MFWIYKIKTDTTKSWSLFGKAEQAVVEFFQSQEICGSSNKPNQIKHLFKVHDRHLDFILLEGSLKADLLRSKIFSDQEAAFLQADPAGKKAFCQFAEFFMNGFKLGHTALGLSLHQYIVPIDRERSFVPLKNSFVFFPKSYQKLYALDSPIAQCFQKCFSIEGHKLGGITLWNLAYQGGRV